VAEDIGLPVGRLSRMISLPEAFDDGAIGSVVELPRSSRRTPVPVS